MSTLVGTTDEDKSNSNHTAIIKNDIVNKTDNTPLNTDQMSLGEMSKKAEIQESKSYIKFDSNFSETTIQEAEPQEQQRKKSYVTIEENKEKEEPLMVHSTSTNRSKSSSESTKTFTKAQNE